MAYTNSVGIMPGAATEKLPFVHSDFKPRSKFAKCFGGFKKFPRHDNGCTSDYAGQKLPLIHYTEANQRNLISMGTKHGNGKPDYPGFAGKKKLFKKKDNNSGASVHPAISGSFTRNQTNAMKQYLSLPNLNLLHQHSETGTFYNNSNLERKRRHHRHKESGEIEFMNYLHRLQQQQQQQQHQQQQQQQQQNNYNMESLFIVDDDDDIDNDIDNEDIVHPYNNAMFAGNNNNNNNVVKFMEPPTSTNRHDPTRPETNRHETLHRSSPQSSHSFHTHHEPITDPFAKEVDKKLREARGKSGVKRDRRRESDHVRILGDVVTAERMHELLLPRKTEGPLNFAENV